ncbi:ADP-ribose diphosphatase [Glaciecola siphonariae]|uniref:ADP-ribose pyrophosphatase n=1 Tax=Glaciecola siphonariae TaxID=521012 RepID=A0ABV9LVF8_9ALTE
MSQFTKNDVKLLNSQTLYSGFFKMVKYSFTHKKYDGSESALVQREVFERGHAVAVLAYDRNCEEFVLIEQFRYPAVPTTDDPWMIEIIAGIIEQGEQEVEVCKREALEEAGVHLHKITKALTYLSSPGGTTERLHIYMAEVDANSAEGIHGLDSESEDIKVLRVSEKQAIAWLCAGKIDNAAAIIALQWFALNKQELFARWDSWED